MAAVHAVFVDATAKLGELFDDLDPGHGAALTVHSNPDVAPEELPAVLAGARIAIVDHTSVPTAIARQCAGLTDIVFLGTGARSYMDPEALAEIGITVHTIKGYGDTAVAECAFALMWASAKRLGLMDRAMREGQWLRADAIQLHGKTLGLIGFGGIARELARMALGIGMEVIAWNRSPQVCDGVRFVEIDTLLRSSDAVSLHLSLNDETRGFLSRERIGHLRDGAILVNTARGALVDEEALVVALRSGRLHAGLDVFDTEPLPVGHPLASLPNVVLSAHSAFRTPEASVNLVKAALAHCDRIAAQAAG